ncbi:MAG: RNA-guided pseudouridylation complex pseudouridine synthase subunit Cbf5, partial [Candidatus Nanoarchaeia archaeon]
MTKQLKELLEFGIINIDKPSGPTSFNVSDQMRAALKELGVRKTSHFGTLDPKVTGVLPIALNRACKLTGFFIGHDKEYVGIMRMHEEISMEDIEKMIRKKFLGKIIQKPPVKSRVKRQAREREIKEFKLLEQDSNRKDILFKTTVQGGTYIRKLIDDLGKELNIGAHMLELRRIRAGIF